MAPRSNTSTTAKFTRRMRLASRRLTARHPGATRRRYSGLTMTIRLLILGGTRFLGRHLAEQALAASHRVTLLHRGRASSLFPDAEHRIGDRNQDLRLLTGGEWDAVVDTSAYFPRQGAVPLMRCAAASGATSWCRPSASTPTSRRPGPTRTRHARH